MYLEKDGKGYNFDVEGSWHSSGDGWTEPKEHWFEVDYFECADKDMTNEELEEWYTANEDYILECGGEQEIERLEDERYDYDESIHDEPWDHDEIY